MAEILGYHSALQLQVPVGADPAILAQRQLAQGITVGDLQQLAATVAVAATRAIIAKYGYAVSLTTEDFVYYADGGNTGTMPRITELSRIEFIHGSDIGHMLPMHWHGRGTGLTLMAMNGIRLTQLESTIGMLVQEAVSAFGKAVETRLFTNTANSIGTAGYDMPFMRGITGLPAGAPQYTPPAYDGMTFQSSHNHFMNSATLETLLNNLCKTLDEHGIKAPYEAVVSTSDLAAYRALAGFIESVDANVGVIAVGGRTDRPIYYNSSELDTNEHGIYGRWRGNYGTVRLRGSNRVPTTYLSMFKSYGDLNAQNPVRIKYPGEIEGRAIPFGVIPIMKASALSIYPIEGVGMTFPFGAGVGNRLNGAVGVNSASAFSNPAIS